MVQQTSTQLCSSIGTNETGVVTEDAYTIKNTPIADGETNTVDEEDMDGNSNLDDVDMDGINESTIHGESNPVTDEIETIK